MAKGLVKERTDGPFFSLGAVVRGVVFSFLVYLLLAALLTSAIFVRSNLETKLTVLTYVSGLGAAFVGAFFSGRRARHAGWLHGLFAAALFVLLSYYLGVIFWPAQVAVGILGKRLFLATMLGVLGGALGANL